MRDGRLGKTDKLEVVKPSIHATHFDTWQDLLITCPDNIAATEDGKAFKSSGTDVLKEHRLGKKLLDFS